MIETLPVDRICPYCKAVVEPVFRFCPYCGKPLEEMFLGIGVGKQIYVYFLSLLLPPYGIIWAMRYMKSPNPQVKTVAWVAIILTILSLGVSVWIILDVVKQVQNAMSKFNNIGGGVGY